MPEFTLDQIQSSYRHLLGLYNAHHLTWEQFAAQVGQLRAQDLNGVWWTIDPRSGGMLRYDGSQWVPAPPVTSSASNVSARRETGPAPDTGASIQAAQQVRSQSGLNKWRARVIATPILALVPALACGGLWFLYTFLGTFKGEGLSGIDFLTPLIIIGIPLLLWAFRKPVDSLLRPFDPILRSIPKPLRYGIVLAVPILLGCACASTSSYGYASLRLSSFASVLAAAVLTRNPGVQS